MDNLHHIVFPVVALVRRYQLSKELRRRDQVRAHISADGAKTERHFTPHSSLGQSILTFGRASVAHAITCRAAFIFTTDDVGHKEALFTNLGSTNNVRALSLLLVAVSWAVITALVVEQWASRLPLGRTVRATSVVVGALTLINTHDADALQASLVVGFAALCLVCQYSGEYRQVDVIVPSPVRTLRASSKSMRIVFLTIGTRGDVQPFVALGRALLKAGHKPVITTHNNFKEWIEKNGIEFQYCGTEMDQSGLLAKAAEGSNVYAWFREALKKITPELYTVVNTHMYQACVGCDMIVSTGHTVGQAMDLAEKIGCLHWCCRLTPHEWFTRSFGAHSQRGSSACGCLNLLNHYKYWGDVGKAYNEANIASLQHAFRSDVLDLSPADPGLQRIFDMFEVPTMFVVSRSVVPQPTDWPVPSTVCGWFFLNEDSYEPPEDLVKFLSGGGDGDGSGGGGGGGDDVDDGDGKGSEGSKGSSHPPVCITFGSMVLVEKTTFIVDAANAAMACGRRVLLITGWASPPKDLPANCFCLREAPHEYIFNKCCCVIHHGGAGTAARVLEAGVPSIVVPILIGADQPWWADRIEELGCGVHVRSKIEGTTPTKQDITMALNRVLDGGEESLRVQRSLKRVSNGIRSEDGVYNFVSAVTKVAENIETKKEK